MKNITTSLILASIIGLVGCSESTQTESSTPVTDSTTDSAETEKAPTLPENFFLAEAPSNVITLSEARASAKTGDAIAFTGYIGGRIEPFSEGRALFLMADNEKAPACTDACAIPWDACCVANEDIIANSASVQVVDEEGKTLHVDMKGKYGLEPGSRVTVVGKVREANESILIVDATGLSLEK